LAKKEEILMLTREEFWSKIHTVEATPTCWPVYKIVHQTIGAIYMLAPRHRPRKVEYIIPKLLDRLEHHEKVKTIGADGTEKFYYFEMSLKELKGLIKDTLMTIREFRELNLTQNEFDQDADPDDPSRSGVVFTSRYTVHSEDRWREEFIDLDACIQNIYCGLRDEEVVGICFESPEGLKKRIFNFMWDARRKLFGPLMDKRAEKEAKEESTVQAKSTETASSPGVSSSDEIPWNNVGKTSLRDYVAAYVFKDSLIRLWKFDSSADDTVCTSVVMITAGILPNDNDEDFDVCREWKVLDGTGWQAKYSDCPVIGVTNIRCERYPEAINIVINPVGVD